jgi:hypothetical protein
VRGFAKRAVPFEHDPDPKAALAQQPAPHLESGRATVFRNRSCSNNKLKRDSDSISSYRALAETLEADRAVFLQKCRSAEPDRCRHRPEINLVRSLKKSYSVGPNTASILDFSVAALNGLTM